MTAMKAFFAWTQNVAVSYYRFISPAKYMRKMKGVEVAYSKYSVYDPEVFAWQHNLQDNGVIRQLEMLMSTADVSIMGGLQNAWGVALIEAIQHKYKRPVLMEIDDYVLTLPEYNVASKSYKSGGSLEWILLKQMEKSDGLVVSTQGLKDLYSQYNKNIYVVPNGVDFEIWDKVKRSKPNKDVVRIGFTGSPNHTGDIRLIKNAIHKILAKYPNVEFYFHGCNPDFLEYTPRIILDDEWKSVDVFPQKVADCNFDIAIAPLKDNNFNRGKSNLRYLEMSALSIPTVASNISDYKRTIHNGLDGLMADTEDEWVNCLSRLIEDPRYRKSLGQKAYDYVKKNYNVKGTAKIYVDSLKEAILKHKEDQYG